MKAWDVLAIARDGEFVCWDCMTVQERAYASADDDEGAAEWAEDNSVSVLFASDASGPETCGRCLQVIDGTE